MTIPDYYDEYVDAFIKTHPEEIEKVKNELFENFVVYWKKTLRDVENSILNGDPDAASPLGTIKMEIKND